MAVNAILARVARLLDLDRPTPGARTTWTVRTAHGVYVVELEEFVSGTRVRLDGASLGHSSAWSFPGVPFRFPIGPSIASLAVRPDAETGTVRATLIVDDARIAPDPPAWRRRDVPPMRWSPVLARAGYAFSALFVSAAAIGDPYRESVAGAVNTAFTVAWLAAIRGIDPFGLLPAWLAAATASRAGLLLFGVELLALTALARRPELQARVPGLRARGRATRAAAWMGVMLVAAVLPTLLGS